ncbi:MAG: histidine kinase N-terminal 7TM domain-containing protein [Balneolales bacterium]
MDNLSIYSLFLLATGGIAGAISVVIFTEFDRAIRAFSLIMGSVSIWALAYAFELSSRTLEGMLFWINIEYIGISLIPAFWLLFCFQFTGFDTRLNPGKIWLVFFLPCLTLFMVWTNDWHQLHYKSTSVAEHGPLTLLNIETGIWYMIHTIVFYTYLLAGMVMLVKKYVTTNRVIKNQILVIFTAVSIPWLANMIYLFDIRPFEHLDITPFAFVVTCLAVSTGLVYFKLFKILPIAREKIIQEMNEGILILNNKLQILDANPAILGILKKSETDVIGKSFYSVFINQESLIALLQKQEAETIEWKHNIDDEDQYFEVNVNPLPGRHGNISGMFMIFRNITENKRNEVELIRARKQAEAANMAKSDFLAHMSHELRTPLSGIIGFVDLMKDDNLTSDQQQYVSIVETSSKSLLHIVNEILDLTKIEAGRLELQLEKVDLPELCRQAVDMFAWQTNQSDLKMKLQISPEVPQYIPADKIKLRQIIINLLGNAVKFTDKGEILLMVERGRRSNEGLHSIRFTVNDTGIGIAEENQQKIFDMFTQGEDPMGKNYSGTGLGLTISNKLLELMGSKIQLKSTPGKGSTFYFDLQVNETDGFSVVENSRA